MEAIQHLGDITVVEFIPRAQQTPRIYLVLVLVPKENGDIRDILDLKKAQQLDKKKVQDGYSQVHYDVHPEWELLFFFLHQKIYQRSICTFLSRSSLQVSKVHVQQEVLLVLSSPIQIQVDIKGLH